MTTADIRLFFNERVLGQEHALDRIVETIALYKACLLYTSDAADERSSVDLGGRRIIKNKIDRDILIF